MADLISIDDNGTLTFQDGASADVFGLQSVNDLDATVTAAIDASSLTVAIGTLGSPEGRDEQSTSFWWKFLLTTNGSLQWETRNDPAFEVQTAGAGEGCAGPATSASSEGCAGASSASSGEGCTTGVASSPGSC